LKLDQEEHLKIFWLELTSLLCNKIRIYGSKEEVKEGEKSGICLKRKICSILNDQKLQVIRFKFSSGIIKTKIYCVSTP
jgi:hypothetical protein